MKKWIFLLFPLLCLTMLPRAEAAEALPFQAGDRIIIWAPEEGKALSAAPSGSYQAAVDVTMEDGSLTGFGESEIWTVSASEEGWKLSNHGQYLSMEDAYTNLSLTGVHDQWQIAASGANAFTFTNTGRNMLICLNSRRWLWNACTPATADRSGITALAVYVLPREEPPEPEPTEPEVPAGPQLYFGLLHGHSTLSDGDAAPEAVFAAAKDAGLDFYALTDHSHSFDGMETASLTEVPASKSWQAGKTAAEQATDGSFLGLFGFEMTWNQGQGHMNTYHTTGFLSREQDAYQGYESGMEHYYAALLGAADSISQFNHPGEDTENFKDFSAHTPALDQRISLIEVDGGLDAYLTALEKGWHLAPAYGGETHGLLPAQGRTVVFAEALTEEALWDAVTARRVYATADADLEIQFSLDGFPMGSILSRSQIENRVTFTAALHDPTDQAIGTVEVMTEGGEILADWALSASRAEIAFTLNANRDFYFLRVTQPDGDWAVTAPIWLDDFDHLGIAGLETAESIPTAGEAQTFRVQLFNNEETAFSITALTAAVEGLEYQAEPMTLAPFEERVWEFSHTFPVDGVYPVTATVTGTLNGEARGETRAFSITVLPPALTEAVVLDCVHGDAGAAHLLARAAAREVQIRAQRTAFTPESLENCRLLLIPAPDRDWAPDFVEQVRAFVNRGDSVILCGASQAANPSAAGQMNLLAEALGLTGRFRADTAEDPVNYVDSPRQLRTALFAESHWLEPLTLGQVFTQFHGCTIDPGKGQWLVKGYETAGSPVLLSAEETPWGGTVFFSGGCLFSDDHITVPGERDWTLPSANQTILETILGLTRVPQPVIPIGTLRTAETGRVYLAEGRITAGTANPNTTFRDTVYIQDETGGIAATGYSDPGLALGTRVQILGTLGSDGENPTLDILRLTSLEKDVPIQLKLVEGHVSYADAGGELLAVEGTVTAFTAEGSKVSRFTLRGAAGTELEILVEDCIRSGSRGLNELTRLVREGNRLRAAGLLHKEGSKTVLRLRDCDEVWLLAGQSEEIPPTAPEDTDIPGPTDPIGPGSDPHDPTQPGGDAGENPPTGDNIGIYVFLMFAACLSLPMLRKRT